MRVVLDTNVLISAMIIKEGKPARLLTKLLDGHHVIIVSRPLLEEFSRISATKRIRKYVTSADAAEFLEGLVGASTSVNLFSKIKVFDTSDDLVLATAYDGKATVIVSGDRALLEVGRFRGIRIVSVAQMLNLV
ncbi:MAG: putative toxin-antitoxin system toxin component, PIN family [Candidatus Micrarchaeota archaeon]|nr:putative toxin-antitoxin system toxin component, PIN family [Candidatus Micrarchaeota archaeon]